ncbi:peroxiredoxin [Massilia sp. UYP11]|uniref:peroxiredoxin n=1 Tax=Massilia sp. UYP11 TaxID=1756385 RepID=UPI003D213D34
MKALKAGTSAPEFELNSTPDQRVKLSDFRGQRVVLAFYPADWSPICGDQLAIYNELRDEFSKHNAICLGISVDGAWCHAAFREQRGYKLALLSDFEPKGEVARNYNVYRSGEGVSERALFVIDEEGVVRWAHVSPIGINPGADGILKALEEMDGGKS